MRYESGSQSYELLRIKVFSITRCTYALEGNPASRQGITMASPPNGLPGPLRELFVEQEKERYNLRLQQLMERDKLVLAAEQEILRVNAHEARAAAGQTVCFIVPFFLITNISEWVSRVHQLKYVSKNALCVPLQFRNNYSLQIPLSVTTVLRDMEIYNTLDPESNLYNPRTGMTAVNPLLDNHVKDPSRYNNGRLFKSWLQVGYHGVTN